MHLKDFCQRFGCLSKTNSKEEEKLVLELWKLIDDSNQMTVKNNLINTMKEILLIKNSKESQGMKDSGLALAFSILELPGPLHKKFYTFYINKQLGKDPKSLDKPSNELLKPTLNCLSEKLAEMKKRKLNLGNLSIEEKLFQQQKDLDM
jgi:hypothetical protein